MNTAHITRAVNQVAAMRGPQVGELVVAMRHAGQSYWELTTPEKAEALIRETPRIEWEVQERWMS